MSGIAAFAVFAAVLTITPGLDTMLVLRTTAVSGRAAGIAAVTGVALGCLVWAVASAAGVTAVLAASRVAFDILRAAGVGYVLWLGGRALWQGRRPRPEPPAAVRRSWGAALRTGFTTNLLNPKVGVFYLSVMPQFLPDGISPLAGSLALGAIHVGEGFVWLSIVVLAANLARGWLTRPTVRRRLEQFTGVVFIGFGVRLALESRSP
jgi:threonine/homoserine/homoserine lactone efflux protein